MKRTLVFTAALLGAAPLFAVPTVEQVRQQESGQQQIRTQTQQVGQQIESIIGEFERNGLGNGEDVKTLKAIRGVLGRLSTKDMNTVIQLLQTARGQSSPEASSRTVTEAYTTQKGVIAQLRQLLIEYQRQQQLFELSSRFSQLAERQHVNLKTAVHLAQETTGKPADQFSLEQKDSLQVQQAEQTAIKDEVGQAMLVLKAAAEAASAGGAIGERLKQAMQSAQQNHLNESVSSPVEDLRQGSLFRAATNEKNARDQLRDIARLVAPPQDRVGALKQAVAALDHHIDEQAKVNEAAHALNKDRPDVAPVAEKQADLVDRTDLTRKDIQALTPAVAEQVKSAEQKMQQVRAALGQKNKDEAAKQGAQASQDLQKARDALKEELAKAELQQQQANQPQDAIAALSSLLERVKELNKQQTALQGKTQGGGSNVAVLRGQSSEQTKLTESTRAVQQDALSQSPEASQTLGEAARQMQTAATTLSDDAQPQKALDNQKQAIAALQRAEKQLTQELAKKEEMKKNLAQLEKARQELAKAIEQQQKVETKTAREVAKEQAAKPTPQPKDQQAKANPEAKAPTSQPADQASKPDPNAQKPQEANAQKKDQPKGKDEPAKPDQKQADQQQQQQAGKQLAKEQTQVSQQTEDARNQLPQEAPQAADALKQAQQNMQQAAGNLDKANPQAAHPDQQKALDHLQQAKNQLDDKIKDLQNKLGQPADPTQAMDNLANAIDKAQKDLGNTMDQLPQADPRQQAMQDLQKQQQQLADDVKKMNQAAEPQAPDKNPLKNAEQAAQKAAQQLADNDPKAAAQSMKQAQDAMQQASKQAKKPDAALPELAGKQEDLRKKAEALAEAPAQPELAQAANQLGQIAQEVAKAGAEDQGAVPPSVSQALQAAQKNLSQASASAEGKNLPQTQSNAQQAQQALTQAKAALQLAQQGLEQGKAMAMAPGQPMPGMMPGMQANDTVPSQGTGNRQDINGGGQAGGPRSGDSHAASAYLGLPPRDRQALQQSQKEKYPAEYAPMVEQYLRNLSDQDQQ
jgi:hypothetical protein